MPKVKNYEYEFEQDLQQDVGVPTIRNISQVNTWSKPNWMNVTKEAVDIKNSNYNNKIALVENKKDYSWEKPNWAVVSNNTSASNNNNNNNNNTNDDDGIVKESVIVPNQHPILKTDPSRLAQQKQQQQAEKELQALKEKLAETQRVKDQLLREQHQQQGLGKTSNGVGGKGSNNGSAIDGSSSGTTTTLIPTEINIKTEKMILDELRKTNKEKEDAAWYAKEQIRREQIRLKQEQAKKKAVMLANHTKDEWWQEQASGANNSTTTTTTSSTTSTIIPTTTTSTSTSTSTSTTPSNNHNNNSTKKQQQQLSAAEIQRQIEELQKQLLSRRL